MAPIACITEITLEFSQHCDLLIKAFKIYVRPILEFNDRVWSHERHSPHRSVQRKFTKRIPGTTSLTLYKA